MTSTKTLQSIDVAAEDRKPLLGAIEGGGTKFVCSIGYAPNRLVDEVRIDTREPHQTMLDVCAFFERQPIVALGVGMFGPLELRDGENYGSLLATPKPGWAGFPFRRYLAKRFPIPIAIDTDVNVAAVGEARWGAAKGCGVVLYVTVGTGVGGGVLVRGQPLHGLMHPEIGHIPLPALRNASGELDRFEGSCPYHGRCLEGLISGPAILRRTGRRGESLDPDDPVFDWAARYLGVGLATAVLVLSPERIVVGGGVMASARLPKVRAALIEALAGYVVRPELTRAQVNDYVVAPGLGTQSGIFGAFALAEQALRTA
ncbi:MAG TPA: ROK family protein [Polyangiaceae bacterium]|nr:ROK family protein [Polyangiaceae bacterium]